MSCHASDRTLAVLGAAAAALLAAAPAAALGACEVELLVLGTSQDGGTPQFGRWQDPAWEQPSAARLSLGLVDHRRGARWLFEATPDVRRQGYDLARLAGPQASDAPILDGVFLTHAHIGHYTGLMFLGHESLGARGVPVHTLPRFADFLRDHGPWSQLVAYENIRLEPMTAGGIQALGPRLNVTAFAVPHRQEYAEVAGFRIEGPEAAALFIPDIDSWEQWDAWGVRIEDVLAEVDIAFLDATFFANGEIPGRDMSGFPHPFVSHSMARFAPLPKRERAKVHFIHFNHTNPLRDPTSPPAEQVRAAGFHVAEQGDRHCLGRPHR
ncbi:MAG: MBL fold metallo-hydrolase [Pseudomonadota bacterium]